MNRGQRQYNFFEQITFLFCNYFFLFRHFILFLLKFHHISISDGLGGALIDDCYTCLDSYEEKSSIHIFSVAMVGRSGGVVVTKRKK